MLSILIPIYNFKVVTLVKALMRQCKKLDIDYEIICFDDKSRKKIKYENSVLSDFFGVNYTELSENLGRARIRNWMAKSASYETLLFLDCDSKIVKKDFVKTYLDRAADADLISGGRRYSKKAPSAKTKRLHWKYGTRKESIKASARQREKYLFFHSNNFLVKRDVILSYPFDESHQGYGYEDLLWAKKIMDGGLNILHIDNPVEHLGLEKSDVFLRKTKQSIVNLKLLRSVHPDFETQLTRFADRIERWGLRNKMYSFYSRRVESFESGLMAGSLSLYQLTILKLMWYWSE
ncbi:MAG: glycosyltransferase family 2 protein [Saprospiraceae bacterium]|jgi:glycosyltransferase involved in cell wall biosynthesis